ncbi:hypothetical protein [Microbacterium sp. NPDC057944]|uniref:hypothetical protein n=1 Tax=Microbacterium sp. NPDC057944 TaxID=3346286 RepID=UPI0036DBF4E2
MALISTLLMGVGISAIGCSSTENASPDRLDRVLGNFTGITLSDFEEGVVKDGVVSSAEYEEAYNLWKTCVEDNDVGVVVERDDFGLLVPTTSIPKERPEQEALDVSAECGEGTFDVVRNLYEDQVLNPDSRDWNEGVVECLIDHDLVDPDYTVEKFLTEELPASAQTEAGTACMSNPFGVTPAS